MWAQTQRIGAFRHRGGHSGKIDNALRAQLVRHRHEDFRQYGCVVGRAVVVEIAEVEILRQRVELMALQFGVDITRHRDGVHVGIIKRQTRTVGGDADKSHVERRVVRDNHAVPRKFEESAHSVILRRSARDHFVGDASQLGDIFGDVNARVGKSVKHLFDLAACHSHSADLGDFVCQRRKTRGFDIEYHELAVERNIYVTVDSARGVVDKIRLGAPDDLLTQLFGGFHGFLKALHVAVVGDRNRAVTPFMRQLDREVGRDRRVHRRHLRVQVQLDAFGVWGRSVGGVVWRSGGDIVRGHIVGAADFFNFDDCLRREQ